MQSDSFGLCDKSLGNGKGINHKSSGFKLLKIKGFSGLGRWDWDRGNHKPYPENTRYR